MAASDMATWLPLPWQQCVCFFNVNVRSRLTSSQHCQCLMERFLAPLAVLLTFLQQWTPVLAQAPDDFDTVCRTDPNLAPDHVFPTDLRLLLDSFDYNSLYGDESPRPSASNPWETRSFDGDDGAAENNNNWMPSNAVCVQPLSSFACRSDTPQDNWLFTHYVSYRGALEVLFNITHNFRRCTEVNCMIPFITIYKYDTDGMVSEEERFNRDNYRPLFGTEEASRLDGSGSSNTITASLDFPRQSDRAGFYLAFRDTGTCALFERVILYYTVVIGRNETFLRCPDVPLPVTGSGVLSTLSCTCINGTSGVGSLERSCDLDGVCNEDQQCECDAGFGYNSTLEMCKVCPVNTFKAEVSNTSCLRCPSLSEARDPGSAICECIPPNSRGGDGPEDGCQDRRISTSAAVAITFFVTFLIVGLVAFLVGGLVAYLCREKIEKVVP